jgi:23S rRNA pseudouridine2604 synthase
MKFHKPYYRQSHKIELMEKIRISKLMAEQGLCSRREADAYIERGWVRVDGVVVSELGSKAYPHQKISLERQARQRQTARVTILLNKPVGYVSAQAERGYRPAVSLITEASRYRGDKSPLRFDTMHLRGLALQDGRIARQLIADDSEIDKEYLVRVQGKMAGNGLAMLRHGLVLDGQALRPAQVSWQNEDQLRFTLREGKKRQVRRMCELVGLKVVGLKRVRMGRIMLGDLPPGQWRYLKENERFL